MIQILAWVVILRLPALLVEVESYFYWDAGVNGLAVLGGGLESPGAEGGESLVVDAVGGAGEGDGGGDLTLIVDGEF